MYYIPLLQIENKEGTKFFLINFMTLVGFELGPIRLEACTLPFCHCDNFSKQTPFDAGHYFALIRHISWRISKGSLQWRL